MKINGKPQNAHGGVGGAIALNYSKNPRRKTLKTLSKHIDFSIIPETTSLVNENDISDSQEFLKGCIDLLNRLFTDERITWGDGLYSYEFNEEKKEGGSKRRERRTKRRTKTSNRRKRTKKNK